jgi:hypothetical protein
MKYAFLIDPRDNQSFWVDHDLSTSGEAVTIADSYVTSGAFNITEEVGTNRTIYHRYPASSINSVNIYYPI